MKALLIDPDYKSIELVIADFSDFREIQKAIQCEVFTTAGYLDGHVIYCDDEGLLRFNVMFTKISHYPAPLAGRLLVLTATPDGDSDDVTMTVEELKKEVKFLTLFEVKKQYGSAA